MSHQILDTWERPPKLASVIVPIRSMSRGHFKRLLQTRDKRFWFMTEVQRASLQIKILEKWDKYQEILSYDGTFRHIQQLRDMSKLGGGVVVIDSEYGMGKSVISNSHLKLWQVIKKSDHPPYVYFRKIIARSMIKNAPMNTAHAIDEGGQRSTGSGSITLEKHIGNQGQTIRKTGKLIMLPGLDVTTSFLGKSIAFKIQPFGINFLFQANRFIVLNNEDEPLYMAVLQRCYYPWEQVFYIDGLGTWAEYENRAKKYSQDSDGVIAGRNPIAEKQYVEDLKIHWAEKYGSANLSLDVWKFEARQIGVPPENSEMVQEVASVAKAQVGIKKKEDDKIQTPDIIKSSSTWETFRFGLIALCTGWEYAEAFGWYTVPEDIDVSYADIVDQLKLSVLSGSLGKQIRQGRRRLRRESPKAIGDLGEKAVTSWLDNCGAVWGGGGSDTNDVTAWFDGRECAINVKTTLADDFKEHLEVTPEADHENGVAVLLVPRRLEIRVYEITGRNMTINSKLGRLATPETLEETIKEMIT